MHRRTITAVGVTATTVLATALTGMGSASAAQTSSRKAVAHTKPAWTTHATKLGHAAKKSAVDARVYLAPRGGAAALQDTAMAISTPGNASYHKYLSAAQYHQRFDATDASVSAVKSFLRSSGLKVTSVAAHNSYVTVKGNVAQAEKAFGATIERYKHAGKQVQAPSKSLTVPTSIASSVLAVSGLDTTPAHVTPASKQDAPPPAGFRNARPCSTYYGQLSATYQQDYKTKLPKFQGKTLPYAVCGYTGPQFRSAYEGTTTLDGTGVTVGIVDAYAAPTIAQDASKYATNHGDGSYAKNQLTQVVPAKFTNQAECGPSGWYGEETLDVEAVHAMAPGANIRYYASTSCEDSDFTDTLQKVVNQDKVQLVSNSYGDSGEEVGSDEVAAENNVFLQGATEGISFLFSSGDDGDEVAATGIKSADFEASDPYVTAVGGTATAIDGNGKLAGQTGWGTEKYSLSSDGKSWTPVGYLYGSGGGQSTLFNQPDYQQGVTPAGGRGVPDVAMDADPTTGMLVGETQTFSTGVQYDEYRIGGTSLASPLFAGMTALAVQKAGKSGGFLNPTIYKNRTKAFTDIKGTAPEAGNVRVDYANSENGKDGYVYSIRTFNQDSSLQVKKGWDDVTGVGVPTPKWFTTL